jgi:hypothetical protein
MTSPVGQSPARTGDPAGPGEGGPIGGRPIGDRPVGRFLMQVLWPAFLVAVIGEGLLFSMIDPQELTIVGLHLADSREAAYTVGFFILWALFSISSGLTYWLVRGTPPETPNLLHGPRDLEHQDKGLIGR